MTHEELMQRAVELAGKCEPKDPKRTPRLGVVIAVDGVIIGEAHRGTGEEGDDDHAEVLAVESVLYKAQISLATVYSTLEPCTHHLRKATSEACTDLLVRENVKKVIVGILDPNQGICGRGVNKLQLSNIEVELFPHHLAQQIRELNGEFIRAQQSVSPVIIQPKNEQVITLKKQANGTWHAIDYVLFECNNPPGPEISLIAQLGSSWWPQTGSIEHVANSKQWKGKVSFGSEGEHTIFIVKANTLGSTLINYYHDVIKRNLDRKEKITAKIAPANLGDDFWDGIPGAYQGIKMSSLSTGLDALAHVTVQAIKDQ